MVPGSCELPPGPEQGRRTSPRSAEFPGLLSDEVDETNRPLSQHSAADLVFTKLMTEKDDLRAASSSTGILDLRSALAEVQRQADKDNERTTNGNINTLENEEEDELIATATEKVTIRPAVDSGAVANVVHPKDLPADVEVEPNETDSHFVGAGGSRIRKFGRCRTRLKTQHGDIGCDWQVAEVTRPLHAVCQMTGPYDGPGKQDVLFNNKKCVVVPPGVVDEILKRIRPVAEYGREGNLYLAEMEMSAFGRRGLEA